MAFLQKFMKRKSAAEKANKSRSISSDPPEEVAYTEQAVDKEVASETDLKETPEAAIDSEESDGDENGDSEREALLGNMRDQLKAMDKSQKQRRRRRIEAMALEAEIHELVSLTARARLHCTALDEEILNKKCEMKFLQSEGLDGHEIHLQAKKNQPVFYKKYNNIKGSNEAKSLLNSIRQSQKALQYLELMTYNRYLEKQHGLHSDTVQKRTHLMLKNKPKHFGHLTDALQAKKLALKRLEPRSSSPVQDGTEANASQEITQVTVSPMATSPVTSTGFTFGGFPMLNMPQDSLLGGSPTNTDRTRFPVGPMETSL